MPNTNITYNGHPVQILQVWPIRNVMRESLFTVRSLRTNQEWDVWGFELDKNTKSSKRVPERRPTKQ